MFTVIAGRLMGDPEMVTIGADKWFPIRRMAMKPIVEESAAGRSRGIRMKHFSQSERKFTDRVRVRKTIAIPMMIGRLLEFLYVLVSQEIADVVFVRLIHYVEI